MKKPTNVATTVGHQPPASLVLRLPKIRPEHSRRTYILETLHNTRADMRLPEKFCSLVLWQIFFNEARKAARKEGMYACTYVCVGRHLLRRPCIVATNLCLVSRVLTI